VFGAMIQRYRPMPIAKDTTKVMYRFAYPGHALSSLLHQMLWTKT